ncbi:hypothetical protein [Pectinatus frisingensis]|uniref:hypothetical protein n=1 Tax=Pectinatus frisingensis TaxID=865 RepID=UPI0018C515C8|nr:hypothetical protein [Pectinatus frisingensis]
MEWVSTKDKLPEENQEILFHVKESCNNIHGYFEYDQFWSYEYGNFDSENVDYWLLIPPLW